MDSESRPWFIQNVVGNMQEFYRNSELISLLREEDLFMGKEIIK